MEKNWSINESAKIRMMKEVDSNWKKILEIGPLYNPLFKKEDYNVFYADINSTEEVKSLYRQLPREVYEKIVNIDYVIDGTYTNTFNETGVKFDYVVSSHVFEHIPNPIAYLLDVSNILEDNGKVCLLLPDKEFTFDHYRENSSFADMYDVYIRGEANNTPRLFLDVEFCRVDENDSIKYWDKTFSKYPNPNIDFALEEYNNYIHDFENKHFYGHYWVFSDRSFLRILESLMSLNILPYKLVSFFPTAYKDNTFGVILELDYSIKNNPEFRKQQINDMREISKNIEKKHFEINARDIIKENIELKETINKIIN